MRAARGACAVTCLVLATSVARGDGFDAHQFVPAPGASGEVQVEHPVVPFHLGLGAGLFLSFADDSVVERDQQSGDIVSRPLDYALTADLLASIGLFHRAELAAFVPVHLLYEGDGVGGVQASGGVGDVGIAPKVRLLDAGGVDNHFVLSVSAPVTFPTGDEEALRGSGGVSIAPRLLAAFHTGPLGLLANAGYRWRAERADAFPFADAVELAGAGLYDVTEDLRAHIEVVGAKYVRTRTDGADVPLEIGTGVGYQLGESLRLFGSVRAGLTDGLGSPDIRVITGVRFATGLPERNGFGDSDGDGIADRHDDCPREAEDSDGFRDEDGCPEADNDSDRVLDAKDQCPELSGRADNEGCPTETYVRIEDGEFIIFGKVRFHSGSAEVRSESEPLLDQVAATLKTHRHVRKVRIEGHTDSVGNERRNQELSEQRAARVKDALIERGIDSERLETRGGGERQPIAPNSTAAGRTKNRRVEFIVLE